MQNVQVTRRTMRRFRANIVEVEKQWVLHILSVCIFSLRYPACNALSPYFHMWPAPIYNIFPHFLTNGTILEKQLLNPKCLFWFSLQSSSEIFLILSRNLWDVIKMYIGLYVKFPIFLSDFRGTWIFSTEF